MSTDSTTPDRAHQLILEQYESCLTARKEWLSVSEGDVGDDVIQMLHKRLNSAVQAYYEALWPYLTNEDAVKEYREEATLWTEKQPKRNENGKIVVDKQTESPVYEQVEVQGLKNIANMFNRTETVQREIKDNFGERTVTETVTKPLPVDVLLKAARLLDQAADDLGLLATVDIDDERETKEIEWGSTQADGWD
jgi:hypothetical protein